MLELILIRHAKSVSPEPGRADFDRTLNRRGEQDAVRIGHRLVELGLAIDRVLCSPARRAKETARLIVEETDFPASSIEYVDAFYNASADTLLAKIQHTDMACQHLALVGHNPGMSWLSQNLTGSPVDMPTCTVAVIQFDVDDWQAVHNKAGRLAHYEYPAGLPGDGA